MKAVVKAPAKINFTLDITGRLPNGYHTVDMVMQAVDLYDIVTVAPYDDGVRLRCTWDYIPVDSSNTAYKAAQLFFENSGINSGASIIIEKHIPTQAGLAGGSTDGAAVLTALNRIFDNPLPDDELLKIACEIGADVPFCLHGGTALATGIGTQLKRLSYPMPQCYILLCKPQQSVSTVKAYALADNRPYKGNIHSTAFIKGLESYNYNEMCSSMYNDFESLLSLEPVNAIKHTILSNGGDGCCMSGSGSTVFGMFSSLQKAQECSAILKESYTEVFIAQPINYGCTVTIE
ncbi:MAG TPA: 4-(cytidine 5'-diphospho)-2-C-methyl-D-erythritol kinase [Clostridiales bacterium]|nr:4-(cytidine 5'-diphospho)-2-C-methyl-D-erythritol kinase [Clostridiales bacterium]